MAVAKDTYFAFGSAATPTNKVDRSTKFNDLKMPRELSAEETTTFGNDGNRSFDPGLKGATFSGSGIFDTTIDTHVEGIYSAGTVVDFDYCPIANTTGNVKYSGKMFVTKYELGAAVGSVVPFQFEGQITGAVTRSIVS